MNPGREYWGGRDKEKTKKNKKTTDCGKYLENLNIQNNNNIKNTIKIHIFALLVLF